jgi:hypothetical protein
MDQIYVLPLQSNEVFTKLGTVKKYTERENRNDQGMCIRIRHTFSANNTTGPAFTPFIACTRSSPSMCGRGLIAVGGFMAGYTVPHEHASSRGNFEDFINAFDSQSRTLFVCSGTYFAGHSLPFFSSNPGTRVIRGIGMRGCWS